MLIRTHIINFGSSSIKQHEKNCAIHIGHPIRRRSKAVRCWESETSRRPAPSRSTTKPMHTLRARNWVTASSFEHVCCRLCCHFFALTCIDFQVSLVIWLVNILFNFVMAWYANLLCPLSLHTLITAIRYPPPAFTAKEACMVTFRNLLGELNSKQEHRFLSAPSMQTIYKYALFIIVWTWTPGKHKGLLQSLAPSPRCHLAAKMRRWSRRIYSESSTWCQQQRPEQERRCK